MNTLFTRRIICAAFAAISALIHLHAQETTSRVALRITSLTSEERDALSRDLTDGGELRIAFACVPAGILIVEPITHDRSAASVRAMAASALIRRLPVARRTDIHLTQAEAEALCAEARHNP